MNTDKLLPLGEKVEYPPYEGDSSEEDGGSCQNISRLVNMAQGSIGESDGFTFWLARPEDYDDVMGISGNVYNGYDYLPHHYHSWMTEPDRVVILAKKEGKLMALESGLVVDGGRTVLVEGIRVCPSERGKGIAGVILRFVDQYIRQMYPSVRVKRSTRVSVPGKELTKFTLLEKRAMLLLCVEAEKFDGFLSQLKAKLAPGPKLRVLDEEKQLRDLLLDPELGARLQLSGGLINIVWQPFQLVESNWEVLRRRDITWLTDMSASPTFLSVHTPVYPIPINGGSLRFNIDLFGMSHVLARQALVFHLERVKDNIKGAIWIFVSMHRSLQKGIMEYCEGVSGLLHLSDYGDQEILEIPL
ncbi:hypothetical protein GJAV_G00197790 [Gymnothorax javanicus]|nr:hypothetical protein GJAV_G00197790 [Gymnothorax javanicus]